MWRDGASGGEEEGLEGSWGGGCLALNPQSMPAWEARGPLSAMPGSDAAWTAGRLLCLCLTCVVFPQPSRCVYHRCCPRVRLPSQGPLRSCFCWLLSPSLWVAVSAYFHAWSSLFRCRTPCISPCWVLHVFLFLKMFLSFVLDAVKLLGNSQIHSKLALRLCEVRPEWLLG